MAPDDSFAFLLPVIMLTFGSVFLVLSRYGQSQSCSWAMGYLCAGAAFLMPLAPETTIPIPVLSFIADGLFTAAFYFYGNALLIRFGRPNFATLRLVFCAVTYAATAIAVFLLQSFPGELVINDLACAGLLAFALVMVVRRSSHMADRVLLIVAGLIVFETVARDVVLVFLIPSYGSAANFLGSPYAFAMQAWASVLALFFGLSALAAATLDVIDHYRHAADNDALTGLLNRRGFDCLTQRLSEKLLASAAVVACDIDEFKQVNDTYGHAAGDRVIQDFATLIKGRLPSGAIAARFGGEEFIILLVDHSPAAAAQFANLLRTAFANANRRDIGIGRAVTASFGIAVKSHNEHDVRDRIARADLALYAAKEAGRNRVMLDGKPPRDATGLRLVVQPPQTGAAK